MKMNVNLFLVTETERLTNGFPDGSNGFSVGSRLATLSSPTIIPGRSRKFAPYSHNKLRVNNEWIKSVIHELNLDYNLAFWNLTNT